MSLINKTYEDSWTAFTYSFADTSKNHSGSAIFNNGGYLKKCLICNSDLSYYGVITTEQVRTHFINKHYGADLGVATKFSYTQYHFKRFNGCGSSVEFGNGNVECGTTINFNNGYRETQKLTALGDYSYTEKKLKEYNIEIPLTTSIEVTKTWVDYSDEYGIREDVKFNVFRSTDQANWTKLKENTDYMVEWTTKTGDTWKATICGLTRTDENGKNYHYKVEEQAQKCYDVTYKSGDYTDSKIENVANKSITITNSLTTIEISGYVWLDEEEGVKPVTPPDGNYDEGETKLQGISTYLYYKDPSTGNYSCVAETVTDENGYYKFENKEIGFYYVEFEYDGINYQETKSAGDDVKGTDSKADEKDRSAFNKKFQTITYNQATASDGTTTELEYNYSATDRKSTLITTENGKVKQEFIMNSVTTGELYKVDTNNLNLGLVERGMDIALSTDVHKAEVNINGQQTTYMFNGTDEKEITIGSTQTGDSDVSYNLNLYASDYNYRIRNYVSNTSFKENDYINTDKPEMTTGEDLEIIVTYEVNLQNQSTKDVRINEVGFTFDDKYTLKFVGIVDQDGNEKGYMPFGAGNTKTVKLDGLTLTGGETKTLYIRFLVNNEIENGNIKLGEFGFKAEVTSYSTDEGLIDVDSQPGNFMNVNKIEDDSDTAGGLTIQKAESTERKITGKVFEQGDSNNPVNDVIVQLIELKEFTVGDQTNVYEYIWQETVSGSGKGYKTSMNVNADGSVNLEEYTYDEKQGQYEFSGFIPGDYIVRFIYGDGTTYDLPSGEEGVLTENIIKYNGQDYKSVVDSTYRAEWYNSSSYTEGASVARDNEARRLETIGYSVEIDASKGVLLKLLNNVTVDDLNETEKEILVSTYNKLNDLENSELNDADITEITAEDITNLLKYEVLKNTWMCAETSKIKVAVDTENTANTTTLTAVNGITDEKYKREIPNINLGLEKRPETKIELKKYITGFKLTAANDQTLVNATIDVNKYLGGTEDISGEVQGIKDSVTILNNVWQYEVSPTEINTLIEGANLEFEYTLVVENRGDTDYLSAELANKYASSSVEEYKTFLRNRANEIKTTIRDGTYLTQIGNSLGNSYYIEGTSGEKVLTEITNIRDYVNNDLTFVFSYEGKVDKDESASKTHRILRDDYSIQETTLSTILKTTESTGKLSNTDSAVMYKVTLGKKPVSSTSGNLEFDTYIAEVMSYTNAAGRRSMTSTPGNAEIIDSEKREGKTHEIDEADTGRIQVGVATGDDRQTNYIIIVSIIAGITLAAVGVLAVKKYVIK